MSQKLEIAGKVGGVNPLKCLERRHVQIFESTRGESGVAAGGALVIICQ